MPSEGDLLEKTVRAAGKAAVWLMKAVVIMLAGLAAALMAAGALALQSAGAMLKALADIATAALPVVLGLIPFLAQALCQAVALAASIYAGMQIFWAFGGDWLALGLAFLLAPTPFMVLYVPAPTASRALASGVIAGVAGVAFSMAAPVVRMFCLFVIFAWLMTRRMRRGDGESGQEFVA